MSLPPLRILDFCWVGAGAFVTRILSDLGAEVIKVELHSHPDNLRLSGPHKQGAKPLEGSGYFASRNNGKKSIALNMRRLEARALALRLAARCSIVTNNFRPGVMEKWGLGYEQVAAVNPPVIYLAMPMQGSRGPHRDFIGFGSTIAALSGLVETSGVPGRSPIGTGTHYPDHVPNPGHALVGLLAAIFHRARTGEGQYVELAQLESTVNLQGPGILAASAGAPAPRRPGNRRAGAAPCGIYPCKGEDRWCAIEIRDDREWQGIKRVFGDPPWMQPPEWESMSGRLAAADEIDSRLANETRRWDAQALAARLQQEGIAAARVATSRDVAEDEQLAARRYWQWVEHAEMGSILANVPPFLSVTEGRRPARPPPLLGEHTLEVARELLDLGEAECRRLVAEEILW